jgi:hypothetical protein
MTTPCANAIGPLVALLLLGSMVSAEAQEGGTTRENQSPKVEIGVQLMHFVRSGPVGAGVRVNQAKRDRFRLEFELDATRSRPQDDQISWFYSLQLNQLFGASRQTGSGIFASYGLAGLVVRTHSSRGHRSTLIPPIYPIVGVGWQHAISRYAALRVDAKLMFPFAEVVSITPRFSGGVSIPIGAYRR